MIGKFLDIKSVILFVHTTRPVP